MALIGPQIISVPIYFWIIVIPIAIAGVILSILTSYFADKSFYYIGEKYPQRLISGTYIEMGGSKRKLFPMYMWAFLLGKYSFDDNLKKWTSSGRLFLGIDIILYLIVLIMILVFIF